MLTKSIIACLDMIDGRVVKGIKFGDFRDAGDPAEAARRYYEQGADEIVFLDITATVENRKTVLAAVERAAKEVFVPITLGGGMRTLEDIEVALSAGADKVSILTAAALRPEFIGEAVERFGGGRIVAAIDAKRGANGVYTAHTAAGRDDTGIDAVELAKKFERFGAGGLLVTSIDADGTKDGYDIGMYNLICGAVEIPVVASGGGGSLEHFAEVFEKTNVSAALAATLFHFNELTVPQVKEYLKSKGIKIRL